MSTYAEVRLWDTLIGAVGVDDDADVATFEYDPTFLESGIEVAPLAMPLTAGRVRYRFPELSRETFSGLPGMLADSLPDRFGGAIIGLWLATQGRATGSLNAVERLCYVGSRGMGALEYHPSQSPITNTSRRVHVDYLVELASQVLAHRTSIVTRFDEDPKAMLEMLRVGTSAGGARAKAVIAWNRETNEVRSGQIKAGDGFEYWLMKFDGAPSNLQGGRDPEGYGALEYAYHLMAVDCGIEMSECRLFEENSHRHFMTKRFDRLSDGSKVHMQSLGAIAHADYNIAGGYSYEQAFDVLRAINIKHTADKSVDKDTNNVEPPTNQLFRRMVFNILADNRDDHVKNIAFLMNRKGEWRLSPAFDIVYANDPTNRWISLHQMTVNGKRYDITMADLLAVAKYARVKRNVVKLIVERVSEILAAWPRYAERAGVHAAHRDVVQKSIALALQKLRV